ncbi:MAG: anthranilate phosphoribosyltransferase [bacterium]
MIQEAIARVVQREDLAEDAVRAVMQEIMDGRTTPSQIASLITALRMKGETVVEITAAARVMRERATAIPWEDAEGRANPPGRACERLLVDTCGTGGDQTHTFNISTAAAFVVAGAGVPVAKHGNRSVSSSCGSADVCEALGINLHLSPERVGLCIRRCGLGFLYAPSLHPAMKHAVIPRREIGIRTIFNVLGPLTNPAGATVQVVGVYRKGLTRLVAAALRELGCRRALVVHGADGMDEITTAGETFVCELIAGEVREDTLHPSAFGIPVSSASDLRGAAAESNARLILDVLQGHPGPRRDVVLLNAGAALYAAGAALGLTEGIEMARDSIDRGLGLAKLRQIVEFTQAAAQ